MKVSIVTVAFNAAATIRDTLESVRTQRGVEIEHLVIDGGSKDATMAIVREYPVRAVSEPDRGLYDAMNKGVRMATGDIVGILNADDVFDGPDAVAKMAAGFDASVDAVYGDICFVRELGGKVVRYCSGRFFRKWMFRFGAFPAHPSTFIRREFFARLGGYSLDYRICADFELMLRYFLGAKLRTRYLPVCTTVMRTGGLSTRGFRSTLQINREDLRALKSNGVWSCLPLMYLRYFAKIWGVVFARFHH